MRYSPRRMSPPITVRTSSSLPRTVLAPPKVFSPNDVQMFCLKTKCVNVSTGTHPLSCVKRSASVSPRISQVICEYVISPPESVSRPSQVLVPNSLYSVVMAELEEHKTEGGGHSHRLGLNGPQVW